MSIILLQSLHSITSLCTFVFFSALQYQQYCITFTAYRFVIEFSYVTFCIAPTAIHSVGHFVITLFHSVSR